MILKEKYSNPGNVISGRLKYGIKKGRAGQLTFK